MSKIEIRTGNVNAFGQKRALPIDGEVIVSEEGIVEVSEECAKLLVDGGTWSYADEEDDSEEITEDNNNGEGGGDDDGNNDVTFVSDTEVLKFMAKQNNEIIGEVIEKNGLDKANPEAYKLATTKAKLVAYIKANMTDEIRGAVTELLT